MCPFRHEPLAIHQFTVCKFWMQGNCTKTNCSFRHMHMKRNRSQIPCFWETQPSGCSKTNCPFLHEKIKQTQMKRTKQDLEEVQETLY